MNVPATRRPAPELVSSILLAGSIVWCALILAAPLVPLPSAYILFHWICHQDPLRSWHLSGEPLAVCVRCASIYFGFLAALLSRLPGKRSLLVFALAATAVEFLFARAVVDIELLRAFTGFVLGMASAGFIERGVVEMLSNRRQPA